MIRFAAAYLSTGVVFLAFDVVWLSIAGGLLYRPLLQEMLAENFRPAPAALFYLLYIAGAVIFAVLPALATGKLSTAVLNGAVLGLVAYGTYDLTNQATLKVWPPLLTVVDLVWGSALTAVAATAGAVITRVLLQRWAGV